MHVLTTSAYSTQRWNEPPINVLPSKTASEREVASFALAGAPVDPGLALLLRRLLLGEKKAFISPLPLRPRNIDRDRAICGSSFVDRRRPSLKSFDA